MKIVIIGQTPAQKNSKQILNNPRTGTPFIASNSRVKQWQHSAAWQLKQVKEKFQGRVQIDYMFYVKDNAERDLDNMMASVNDALQIANAEMALKNGRMKPVKGTGIIKGDNWQYLRVGSADAAIDRINPRAEMTITEIEPVN